MSSSPKPTIINSESIQPRRKWLKSKLDNLQQSYNDVLLRFKQRLDAIVTPVIYIYLIVFLNVLIFILTWLFFFQIINETDNILSATDEVLFFKKHFEIGINIEKSCHDLFEINLLCCNEEKTLYDSKSCRLLCAGSIGEGAIYISTDLKLKGKISICMHKQIDLLPTI